MPPTRYIAEDVPAYSVVKDWPHRPTTDEGHAMTAPVVVLKTTSEGAARHALAMRVITQTASMDADLQKVYFAAADAITGGVDAVQISGRVFRIRTITEENPS